MRNDIQFLRGIAVLFVVLYHAEFLPIPSGFLGVDIFFVISGFLITTIILRDLNAGNFSIKQFYIRRAKRLLPAAYSTFIFTTLLSYAFLTNTQWKDYIEQLFGAVTYSANIILPFQTGYFEQASAGKPLLHIWSLSLEEQYYFLIPLFLIFIAKKWRGWFFLTSILISLLLCWIFSSYRFTYWRVPTIDSQIMAFYLLPFRAWELLIGSIAAWLMLQLPLLKIPAIAKQTAFTLLPIVIIFPVDNIHPRGDALIVVLITVFLLLGRDDWLPLNWLTRSVAKVGDWSYSLYLVHWPLFAFAYIAYLGKIPEYVMWLLFFLSLVLAYLQYTFVEQRFRYGWQESYKKTLNWLVASSFIVFLLPVPAIVDAYLNNSADSVNFAKLYHGTGGLNKICALKKGFVEPSSSCMTSDKPTVAVWGDSYAMHLLPGLKADPQLGNSLIQLTMRACAPIRGVALINSMFNESWAKTCIDFNEKVFKYIQDNESIEYVILSSPFQAYFDHGQLKLFFKDQVINGERSLAIKLMVETIEALHLSGKKTIIISPPPKPGINIGECLQRKAAGLLVLGFNRSDCNFQIDKHYSYQRGIIDALEEIQRRAGVEIIWLYKLICERDVCLATIDNIPIYRDGGHLTAAGSELLIPQLRIADQLFNNRQIKYSSNPAYLP